VIARPLDARSDRAVRDALVRHGWDPALAADAAAGLTRTAVHLEGLGADALEALVAYAGGIGVEVVTGDDWAIVAGSASRLGALARPWMVPPALSEVAAAVGHALPAPPPSQWVVRGGVVALDPPVITGILNVTPDSFSDGGRHATVESAVARAEELLAGGARVLDLGGESTRPGREALVSVEEELARVLPVLGALLRRFPDAVISVDTMKSEVARAALGEGAHAINDVTGLRHDPRLADVVAAEGAGLVLMHSRGPALEIASYVGAEYGEVAGEVISELSAVLALAVERGVSRERIVLDPGFGFSKRPEQNILLADQLQALAALGQPVMVGPSRKRFLGAVTGAAPEDRDAVTATCCALCHERGARLFRVHDAARTREALALVRAFGGTLSDS
jgi:dihydropteroate synthase